MIAIGAILIGACTSPSDFTVEPLPDDLPALAESPVTVLVDDNVFIDDAVTVTTGTTVTWTWQGRAAHDVVGPGFNSGIMIAGEFSQAFTEIGTYAYICTLHPRMTGVIYVVDGG